MSKKILDNGVERDATTEELEQWEADKIKDAEDQAAYTASQEAKAATQNSGNTKLLNLGLTQEEITALTGYAPSE